MMLIFLKRLGVGFTYGIGFSLAVAGLLALTVAGGASYMTTTKHSLEFPSNSDSKTTNNLDQFAISGTSAVKTDWGSLNILGTVVNNGDDTPRYVNVYADLYDKSGKFIYQCMQQFHEGLRNKQKLNFMIECQGMPKDLVPSYDRFEVYVRKFE